MLVQLTLCFGCCGALRSDFGLCGFVWLGACFVLVCVCMVLGFRFAVRIGVVFGLYVLISRFQVGLLLLFMVYFWF